MKNTNKTLWTYVIGFITSLVLTFAAYILTLIHISSSHEEIPHIVLIPALLLIALIQLAVQLLFFLHLGEEKRPRWNFVFFINTFISVVIVIVASIWIMNHLNYNMSPKQQLEYIQSQSGI